MTRAVAARASEWPSIRLGLVVAAAALLAAVVVGVVQALTEEEPEPRLVLVERCLRREKLLEVRRLRDDPIAVEARGGALATRVAGNGLHLAIAGSEDEAEKLAGFYRDVGGPLVGKLEQRRLYVFLWEGVATPTQRQTVYDCTNY